MPRTENTPPAALQPADRQPADRQSATVSLMVSKHAGVKANVELTERGIYAVAALVSSILLSTAALVYVAVREGKR